MALQQVDAYLGQTLFVGKSRISPDGGIIEVRDDHGNWRVVLVSEAKHQGKDIENIQAGKLVGKKKNQESGHLEPERKSAAAHQLKRCVMWP